MNASVLISQGFLLGLSSGVTCLTSCAPVLLPLLVGSPGSVRRQGTLMAEYLTGRLAGYLGFGFLVWFGAQSLPVSLQNNPAFKGVLNLLLGSLMLLQGIHLFIKTSKKETPASPIPTTCLVSPWKIRTWLNRCPRALPVALGFVSGLNLCPPFVVALTQGGFSGDLWGVLIFFFSFFVATALFFVPFPFVGKIPMRSGAAHVATFAAILVGLFFLYVGTVHLLASFYLL